MSAMFAVAMVQSWEIILIVMVTVRLILIAHTILMMNLPGKLPVVE